MLSAAVDKLRAVSHVLHAPLPHYFPEGRGEREKAAELIKGVVLQLSDSESYRIVS